MKNKNVVLDTKQRN